MTATVPPLRGAGEVAPLPMTRAPTGTSQLNVRQPGSAVHNAPPTAAHDDSTDPSASSKQSCCRCHRRASPEDGRTAAPRGPRRSRVAARRPHAPQQPAARRPSRAPPPQRQNRDAHPFAAQPVVTGRPPIDAPGDIVYADHWFEASRAMDPSMISTSVRAPVPKTRSKVVC